MPHDHPQRPRWPPLPLARLLMTLYALTVAPVPLLAAPAPGAPAVTRVQALSRALLRAMKAGPATPATARYRQLEPVIERVFALPFMTRLSVGPDWATFSPQQRSAVIAAFSRYTIANYAHNFRKFSGQSFKVGDNVIIRGKDEVIQTSLASPGATPTSLLYRMRDIDGTWKIVDVYYNGVSQLTLHRVQFASAIASGGAPVLVAYLNRTSDNLMK